MKKINYFISKNLWDGDLPCKDESEYRLQYEYNRGGKRQGKA